MIAHHFEDWRESSQAFVCARTKLDTAPQKLRDWVIWQRRSCGRRFEIIDWSCCETIRHQIPVWSILEMNINVPSYLIHVHGLRIYQSRPRCCFPDSSTRIIYSNYGSHCQCSLNVTDSQENIDANHQQHHNCGRCPHRQTTQTKTPFLTPKYGNRQPFVIWTDSMSHPCYHLHFHDSWFTHSKNSKGLRAV